MKRITLAMALAAMIGIGSGTVAAEMVDIGTGQMPLAEFEALKSMVRGDQPAAPRGIVTPVARPERYGPVELTPQRIQALEALRRMVVAYRGNLLAIPPGPSLTREVTWVDIGTGRMPRQEYGALRALTSAGELSQRLDQFQRTRFQKGEAPHGTRQ